MKGLAIYYSQGSGMNSKMYPAYLKSKEKSMKDVEENDRETLVNIENFTKIEIINSNGRVIGIFDITRFDGVVKFS